jgi:hypothetical protein
VIGSVRLCIYQYQGENKMSVLNWMKGRVRAELLDAVDAIREGRIERIERHLATPLSDDMRRIGAECLSTGHDLGKRPTSSAEIVDRILNNIGPVDDSKPH